MAAARTECCWVDGVCIDVTNYAEWHPGGDIIEHFVGRDATTVFHATHPPKASLWLKSRTIPKEDAPPAPSDQNQKLRARYMQLHASFSERGWLTPTLVPMLKNLAISGVFFTLALFCPGHCFA